MKGRLRLSIWALAALSALLMPVVVWMATGNALSEGMVRADYILRQTVNALDSHLRRYDALPALLAQDDDILLLRASPDNPQRFAEMNRWLGATNALIEASDLYLINLDGDTISASNHDRADSFIGQNFSYRPYFTKARNGSSGRYFALGTTSGLRGYYFASPVRDGVRQVVGVLALKIGVDAIEAGGQAPDYRILVTDPEGVVLMSTAPDWLSRGLLPLTTDRRARLAETRRHSDATLTELQVAPPRPGKWRFCSWPIVTAQRTNT